MHLNECFQLALSRPAADADEKGDSHDCPENNDLSFLADSSQIKLQQKQQPQPEFVQGSILSMLHCIASEWGTKSQTNFYIPPEHYAGYSYLFEDDDQQQHGWHSFDNAIRQQSSVHHNTHSHFHAHRHPAFVYAEELNNLHPHHYDVYVHGSKNSTQAAPKMTPSLGNNHILHSAQILTLQQNINSNTMNHAPMTVPYIHPHLDMPIPPLHLPWYFGMLCWTFSLAGVFKLYLPPKWTRCGGGRVGGGREDYHRRHWFPYRTFAWALLVCQSPCSFLADYVHMTNISPWHSIDRFIACFMMSLELVKLLVMRPYTRPLIYLLYLISVIGAVFCFLKSQKSQETMNEDSFIFWHNGWHCYPLACIVIFLLENYLNIRWGEYYAFESDAEGKAEECKRGERGGILLSTIAMNYAGEKLSDQSEVSYNDAMEYKEWKQNSRKLVKTKTVLCHDGETVPSFTRTNCMASPVSPGLRRSRRIAGQKPEVLRSL
ncbi:hypothetical protein ACHAXR_011624 [Thalassiosira sp. AJA248-18]